VKLSETYESRGIKKAEVSMSLRSDVRYCSRKGRGTTREGTQLEKLTLNVCQIIIDKDMIFGQGVAQGGEKRRLGVGWSSVSSKLGSQLQTAGVEELYAWGELTEGRGGTTPGSCLGLV